MQTDYNHEIEEYNMVRKRLNQEPESISGLLKVQYINP